MNLIGMHRNHRFHINRISIIFVMILVCTSLPAQNAKGIDDDIRMESEQLFHTLSSFAGKVMRITNTVVREIGAEMREFNKDIEECCPEFHEVKDSLKVQMKRGLEQCRREFHRGFRQGLRGESYDPTKY